jgi:hypothetical protein
LTVTAGGRQRAAGETTKYWGGQLSVMSLVDSVNQLVESVVEMPSRFAEVAAHDPLNPVLMAFGVLFVGASVAALGYLSLGALVSLFTRDWSSEPPRGSR